MAGGSVGKVCRLRKEGNHVDWPLLTPSGVKDQTQPKEPSLRDFLTWKLRHPGHTRTETELRLPWKALWNSSVGRPRALMSPGHSHLVFDIARVLSACFSWYSLTVPQPFTRNFNFQCPHGWSFTDFKPLKSPRCEYRQTNPFILGRWTKTKYKNNPAYWVKVPLTSLSGNKKHKTEILLSYSYDLS